MKCRSCWPEQVRLPRAQIASTTLINEAGPAQLMLDVDASSGSNLVGLDNRVACDVISERATSRDSRILEILRDSPLRAIGCIWITGTLLVLALSLWRISRFSLIFHESRPASEEVERFG